MLGIRLKANRPHHASHLALAARQVPRQAPARPVKSRPPTGVTAGLLLLAGLSGLTLASGPALGGESGPVAWHRSLEQATTAAAQRNRQVLVLFTAAWSPASTQLRKHVLTDPDAVALLNACFEPVLIDVDDDPETTNSLRIRHVPGGCILAADGTVISRFECPSSTGLFIATVARQLQQVPAGDSPLSQPAAVAGTVTVVAERAELANDFSTAGSLLADAAATGPTTESGAVGQIAAKVRGLSHFAASEMPIQEQLIQEQLATAKPATPAGVGQPVPAPPFSQAARPLQQPQPAAGVPAVAVTAGIEYSSAPPAAATPPQPQLAEKPAWTTTPLPAEPFATSQQRPTVPAFAAQPALTSSVDSQRESAGLTSTTAPWATEPGEFVAETPEPPTTHPWQATPTTTLPAAMPTATLATAIPPVTGGLIEPEGSTAPPPASTGPWLQPAPQPTPKITASTNGPTAKTAVQAADTAGQLAAGPAQPSAPAATPAAAPQQEAAQPAEKQPNAILAAITNPFGLFKQEPKPTAQQKSIPEPRQTQQARYAEQPAPAGQPTESEPMPLGLEGYCPVTLVESGGWVEGQAGWGARHRGRTYLFRGLEQQQAFLADPDRYAPALSGDDPVAAFDSATSLPGERRYGVTYQQRIYLFASPESRATFAANPQRYTSRVQLAEQPTDVVTEGTILR